MTTANDTSTSSMNCTWPECTNKRNFSRQSDLRKHLDKHTRPYSCINPACNDINFGDKAGLLRHQRERHGAAKFFCQVPTCTRNRRGFARKRNMDAHMATRHTATTSVAQTGSKSPESMGSPEEMHEDDEMAVEGRGSARIERSGMIGLEVKLLELERRREELAACQLKVDEDIQAVKRTMELIAVA